MLERKILIRYGFRLLIKKKYKPILKIQCKLVSPSLYVNPFTTPPLEYNRKFSIKHFNSKKEMNITQLYRFFVTWRKILKNRISTKKERSLGMDLINSMYEPFVCSSMCASNYRTIDSPDSFLFLC